MYELTVSVLDNQDSRSAWGVWRSTVDDAVLPSERFNILALPGKKYLYLLSQRRWLTNIRPGDPSSDQIRQRPLFHDYGGSKSKSCAVSLLTECDRSHTKCRSMHPSRRPKRLLRIDKDEGNNQLWIYLDITPQPPPTYMATRYSALSYCWGRDQEHKLEVASLTTYESGVAISKLSKTLQDAALLSWDLGLKFIWIDCLCILQDDKKDLAREIADLPAIFGNAYITISASRASDSREGFLHPISRPPTDGSVFSLPYACPNGRLGSVILYPYIDNPIHSRAWTFQEFMLSPRILEYTSSQLRWICREREWHYEEKEKKLVDLYQLSLSLHSGVREHCSIKECEIWMTVVWAYSGRALKFSADKLPAISGLAELWSRRTREDSYLAGLWRSHLPSGLLWLNEHPSLQQGHAYRAPSWSWASLNGSIAWHKHMLTTVDPNFKVLFSSVECMYDDAPYGAVSSGSLTVRGHLCRCVLSSDLPSNSKLEQVDVVDLEHAEIHYDDLDSSVAIPEIFCLQICEFEEAKRLGPSGLLLVKAERKQYRRIGLFHFRPLELMDIEEKEIVNIKDRVEEFQLRQEAASKSFRHSHLEEVVLV
jgi:hypothetical protein